MCSVFGILDIKSDASKLRESALEMSKKMRHRGPDWSGVYSSNRAILVHERLAIVDLNSVDPSGRAITEVHNEAYKK